MVKLLSYIYPITKKVKSVVNGTLEITWYNGKKHLNTKNANYSYGSLQRILKYGLDKLDLTSVRSILVLGLGGGSVIETLKTDFSYQGIITAVDIDPEIIDIAKNEFQIEPSKQLHIVCDDAYRYVKNTSETFNLIIIDIFIDVEVPKQFLEIAFWEHIIKIKSANGAILFNASLDTELSQQLEVVISFLKSHLYHVEVFKKVNDTNTLVIGKSL